jgi:hypothetical protein
MQAHRDHFRWRSGAWPRAIPALAGALAVGLASCTGGESITRPTNDVASIAWDIQLNHRAVNMAVGSTVQLEAVPVTVDGTPIADASPITWVTPDTTILAVDATGNLRAKKVVERALVVATIHNEEGNWTIADSARVTVYPAVLPFSSFKMALGGPTLVTADDWRDFDAVLFDGSGNALLDAVGDTIYPVTDYVASKPQSVWYQGGWNGGGSPNDTGVVKIEAHSYIFGQEYTDTVTFRLTYPDSAPVFIYRKSYNMDPSPSVPGQTDVTILKGGKIAFSNINTTLPADILFDDTTQVIGGNIPEVPMGYGWQTPPAIVEFPNTGTFTYHSPSLKFEGTITVVDWPEWP